MCTVLSKSGERAEVFNFFLSLSPFMYNHDQFLSFQSNHFTSDFDLTVDQGAADKPSENELEVRSGVAGFEPVCELANLQHSSPRTICP